MCIESQYPSRKRSPDEVLDSACIDADVDAADATGAPLGLAELETEVRTLLVDGRVAVGDLRREERNLLSKS